MQKSTEHADPNTDNTANESKYSGLGACNSWKPWSQLSIIAQSQFANKAFTSIQIALKQIPAKVA
jgi:hypothetical protein